MLDLLTDVMGAAAGHCAYAEARFVDHVEERAAVRSGRVEDVDRAQSVGIGVRVRVGGAWGFAATREISKAGAHAALARALAFAAVQPATRGRPLAALSAPAVGRWESPCVIDPLTIPLAQRLELLAGAEALLRGDPRIVRSEASAVLTRTQKAFASTDGAACEQVVVECGAGIQAMAVDGGELQVRSYPTAHGGALAQSGWEHVLALDLAAHAPRVAEEAIALLNAPPCPTGERTVILAGDQIALQVHESIGHALELDRILLGEASYAGTSWVEPGDLGTLRYGSDAVTVSADATLAGGLGSFGWDDEGVAARRDLLIDRGVLKAALSDRESAAAVGLPASGGAARADGFARQPIVRMTNVSLEPGTAGTLADLLADTEDGALLLDSNRSWSIDDRRWQFQFATEVAYEIRGGERGRLYRNPSYAGITPRFWGACDAVCGAGEWSLWGVANCGKGEPGQLMRVSHGGAPARFRGVQVGIA